MNLKKNSDREFRQMMALFVAAVMLNVVVWGGIGYGVYWVVTHVEWKSAAVEVGKGIKDVQSQVGEYEPEDQP